MNNNEEITFKSDVKISAENLATVFKASGIKRPDDDLNRLRQMIENSNILITAWNNNELIGVARGITDYSYCCYLSDLAVTKQYQSKGIGKELVRRVQNHIGDEVALILLSSPTAIEYYPKIGFKRIENAFKIARER